ncbi:hypothetical protein Ngar_c13600 [Candidatus Nitrososphaera gargensis Ga9.2]|uniref:Uncharacterized protein n=1 Tax=Nitrososphaera gargensis (strain Ga9.2) TaxID=1237085 RepID=K0IHC3_NITGG|nr:hypothetical protein [Candidatus Nitrososphaera gargensis]AFU58298.1 hypothetical protein Ngar_c13600 [Candidatus Nitrososphaera gargensis Ga9.2]
MALIAEDIELLDWLQWPYINTTTLNPDDEQRAHRIFGTIAGRVGTQARLNDIEEYLNTNGSRYREWVIDDLMKIAKSQFARYGLR